MSTSIRAIQDYSLLSDEECDQRIIAAKEKLGDRCAILGHHYQRNEVFKHADYSGDSLKLSHHAAHSKAEFIVFCGVHFMAEVSDILSRPEQITILPDLAAGCSMADMANRANVERSWKELNTVINADEQVTPVTYINSAADLKAFCGKHEGIVCTSSNAKQVLEWCFEKREKILFFPDEHLGRNTGYRMDIPLDEMVVWDFMQPMGGLTKEQIKSAKMILWKGFCSVHQMFKPNQIDDFKKKNPNAIIVAHPEASFEVCEKADYVGSTEMILKTVRDGLPNTTWLIATELNLVNRLQEEVRDHNKTVQFMSPTVAMCSTMFRTDPQHLAWVLENLVDGHVVNQIQVDEDDKVMAKKSLESMLSLF